ncbi:response regulator [Paenibacillus puldeungensis]|uniref:Response regulator n=1 Tax=Paenibacillus puldeungensis TaxID=696536 RepID=A0ABW3S1E4_9BACL
MDIAHYRNRFFPPTFTFLKTILLVDDEPDIVDLHKLFLEKDFDVLGAHDGHAAVELFSRHSVDLAVIDIMMGVKRSAATGSKTYPRRVDFLIPLHGSLSSGDPRSIQATQRKIQYSVIRS